MKISLSALKQSVLLYCLDNILNTPNFIAKTSEAWMIVDELEEVELHKLYLLTILFGNIIF